MYWNKRPIAPWKKHPSKINRNMRCIEMIIPVSIVTAFIPINRNMRCIEIPWALQKGYALSINRNMRCIEITHRETSQTMGCAINRNMRCIEIHVLAGFCLLVVRINRNMRCIEILQTGVHIFCLFDWLIETWDVLKLPVREFIAKIIKD